jgi:hypothetical protein
MLTLCRELRWHRGPYDDVDSELFAGFGQDYSSIVWAKMTPKNGNLSGWFKVKPPCQ